MISLSPFMIMNTRDKEITDQPRLNHFDLKSNSTCNRYMLSMDHETIIAPWLIIIVFYVHF